MSKKTAAHPGEEPNDNRPFPSVTASEQFGPQWSSTHDLPDPTAFALNFTQRALEVLQGSRDIGQISRWASEDVFQAMKKHVSTHVRKQSVTLVEAAARPVMRFTVTRVHLFSPRDGVMEVCVLARGERRVQAAALRMEGLDGRWRTTSFSFL